MNDFVKKWVEENAKELWHPYNGELLVKTDAALERLLSDFSAALVGEIEDEAYDKFADCQSFEGLKQILSQFK